MRFGSKSFPAEIIRSELHVDSLAILIPVALVLSIVIIAAFLWAVKSDQFEDLERHGQDIFFDSESEPELKPDQELRNKDD